MTRIDPGAMDGQRLALEGLVDEDTVISFHQWATGALDAGHGRIAVDLSAVTGVAVPTLSVFCAVLRGLSRRNATLAVIGGPPHVQRAVELCAIPGVERLPRYDAVFSTVQVEPAASQQVQVSPQ